MTLYKKKCFVVAVRNSTPSDRWRFVPAKLILTFKLELFLLSHLILLVPRLKSAKRTTGRNSTVSLEIEEQLSWIFLYLICILQHSYSCQTVLPPRKLVHTHSLTLDVEKGYDYDYACISTLYLTLIYTRWTKILI